MESPSPRDHQQARKAQNDPIFFEKHSERRNTIFKATEGRAAAMKDRWDSLNHSEDIKDSRINAKEYQEAAKSISSATSNQVKIKNLHQSQQSS